MLRDGCCAMDSFFRALAERASWNPAAQSDVISMRGRLVSLGDVVE
jgi:hypothetical protein